MWAFAAVGQALLDASMWFGQQADAFAGSALAAEVVGETLAVGGLRKHTREGVLADSTRTSEEQCVRDAVAAQCTAKRGHQALVAEEFGEAHANARPFRHGWRFWRRAAARSAPALQRRCFRVYAYRCARHRNIRRSPSTGGAQECRTSQRHPVDGGDCSPECPVLPMCSSAPISLR